MFDQKKQNQTIFSHKIFIMLSHAKIKNKKIFGLLIIRIIFIEWFSNKK